MGLDIYKYEYDKQGDNKVYINQNDLMNPYFKPFIKKYFQYLESEMNEYYNTKKYLELNNINDVNFISHINNSKGFEIVLLDNTKIKVKTDKMPVEIRLEYYLRVNEIGYQRKQIRQIKPLSYKNSNIRNWNLKQNQLIVCDW